MKKVLLASVLASSLAATANAQSKFGINFMPMFPNYIVKVNSLGGPVDGSEIESVVNYKLTNNADGQWTMALTVRGLAAAWGGDGSSTGVLMGTFEPYNLTFTPNTQAAALNSGGNDLHISLSTDGRWAVIERVGSGVYLGYRAAVGLPFGAPVLVAGSPTSTLSSQQVHPYLGNVGGIPRLFYTDGDNILMDVISLDPVSPSLAGNPVVVATEVQGGTQPGSPSPMVGPDGDVEALFACDIVIPQLGPGTGDADPTVHNDLDPTTPGVVQVNRTDWQGWGGPAGGFIYFSHDVSAGNFHLMHGEGAILLGDSEAPGGTVDMRIMSPNYGTTLTGTVLFGVGEAAPVMIPGIRGTFALMAPAPVTLSGSTNAKDGMIDLQFVAPATTPSGVSVAIQAVTFDAGSGFTTFSNTAWIHL